MTAAEFEPPSAMDGAAKAFASPIPFSPLGQHHPVEGSNSVEKMSAHIAANSDGISSTDGADLHRENDSADGVELRRVPCPPHTAAHLLLPACVCVSSTAAASYSSRACSSTHRPNHGLFLTCRRCGFLTGAKPACPDGVRPHSLRLASRRRADSSAPASSQRSFAALSALVWSELFQLVRACLWSPLRE